MAFVMKFTHASDNYPLLDLPGVDGLRHIYARSPGHGGDAWIHLIPGTEKALVLDTGFGIGDLRALIDSLTDLPTFVVNSHNHIDHVGSNCQWDKVYIHKNDVAGLIEQTSKLGIELPLPAPEDRDFVYTDEDIVYPKEYEIIPIENGHVFDLGGGYEIEVIHVPGHSAGGIVLLDRKRRILFTGDALLASHVFVRGGYIDGKKNPYNTIEKYREGLSRIMEHFDEFDLVYGSHSRLGVSKQLVLDFAACCDELLAGDLTINQQPTVPACSGFVGGYHRHGMARINFSPDFIHVD
ncbi:MAG: MBL fold metallo-hydrolase [Clostridiales bacterium]|nr:MBL fold metallo-hydrolase [Clostridiales bacterium]